MQCLVWQKLILKYSDADMYLFFKESNRDEVSYIFKRSCKVSNKYLKYYDIKQE